MCFEQILNVFECGAGLEIAVELDLGGALSRSVIPVRRPHHLTFRVWVWVWVWGLGLGAGGVGCGVWGVGRGV